MVWNDAPLLKTDFPWLLAAQPDELAEWLLGHAALISVAQASQSVANSPIPTQGEPIPVYRLPRGGRAFFAPVVDDRPGEGASDKEGLLALKGVGVASGITPTQSVLAHGNGLLPLHEIFKEVLWQRLIESIIRHAGRGLQTLSVYAVLDLGFDIRGAEGERWPAGVLVRRAHRRPRKGWDLPVQGSSDQVRYLDMELLLRRYGVTSVSSDTTLRLTRDFDGTFAMYYYDLGQMERGRCPQSLARSLWNAHAPRYGSLVTFVDFEGINIQTTRAAPQEEPELIDFGAYRVREFFEWPLLSRVRDREANWGGLIPLDSPHFIQPDPGLALQPRYWQEGACLDPELRALSASAEGEGERGPAVERFSPVDRLCLQLARAFRAGQMSGGAIQAALATFVGQVTAHWAA